MSLAVPPELSHDRHEVFPSGIELVSVVADRRAGNQLYGAYVVVNAPDKRYPGGLTRQTVDVITPKGWVQGIPWLTQDLKDRIMRDPAVAGLRPERIRDLEQECSRGYRVSKLLEQFGNAFRHSFSVPHA